MKQEVNFSQFQAEQPEETREKSFIEKVQTEEFLEFGNKAKQDEQDQNSSQKLNIEKMLNSSILPKSLKERFGVELRSKAAKKRYKRRVQRKLNKKKVKIAKFENSGSKLIESGNLFEALKRGDDDGIEDITPSGFGMDEEAQKVSFADKVRDVENKLQNSKKNKKKRKKDKPKFGLMSKKKHQMAQNKPIQKPKNKKKTKFGKVKNRSKFKL